MTDSDFDTAYWDSLFAADPGDGIEPPPPIEEDEPMPPTGPIYEAEDDDDPDKQIRLEDLPPHLRSLIPDQPANPHISGGFAGSVPLEEETAPNSESVSTADTTGPALEAAVFGATPRLKHIRKAAHSRMVTPWAVLGAALARVVAEVPPHIVLPAVIGSDASLNLAHGLVAGSGGGKSGAEGCAADVLRIRYPRARTIGPGSGEAIVQSFLEWDKDTQANRLVEDPLRMVSADEIGQIGAVQGRSSQASFAPILRTMISGGRVGTNSVESQRTRYLERNTYRLMLVTGIQPPAAGILLDDQDAGTPQRFVWWQADDPNWDVGPTEWPGALEWDWQPPRSHDMDGMIRVPVCDKAREAVIEARRRSLRREGNPLDGHRVLTQEKVAAALSILHDGLEVSEFWWDLAGEIMRHSDATRAMCVQAVTRQKEADVREQGRLVAVRDKAARESRDEDNLRYAKLLWKTVTAEKHGNQRHGSGAGCTERCLTYALHNHRGVDKDAAIRTAIEQGWIEKEDGRYWPGLSQPVSTDGKAA